MSVKTASSAITTVFGLTLVLTIGSFANSLFTEASDRFQSAINGETVKTAPLIAGITTVAK